MFAAKVVAVASATEDDDDIEDDEQGPRWAGPATNMVVERFGKKVRVFTGDLDLTASQWAALGSSDTTVVVLGNLSVTGELVDYCPLLVVGDIACDRLRWTSEEPHGGKVVVGGQTVARQYAYLQRQPWGCGCGCMDRDFIGFPGKLTTPRLFCYWVRWRDSELDPSTALHLITDPDTFVTPELAEWYDRCNDYNVLRPECVIRKKGDHGEDGRTDGLGR
ncbi:MAG: hypothetical protein FWE61_05360, partial [Micrococcales bacterium]|nr:hypothetical protein [Micrococcales bacterium]